MNHSLSRISFTILILMLTICLSTSLLPPTSANAQENSSYYNMPENCPIFWRGPNNKHVVALTFDDGPSPINTPQILNILAKHNAKATFFLIGERAKSNPELVQMIIAAGHEVGSHSMTHPDIYQVSQQQLRSEVIESVAYFEDLTKQKIRFFRPPYDYLSIPYLVACSDLGVAVMLWSIETDDWQGPPTAIIVDRVISNIQPGSIIILHDGGNARPHTVEALDKILYQLEKMQLQPVTLSSLFSEVLQ